MLFFGKQKKGNNNKIHNKSYGQGLVPVATENDVMFYISFKKNKSY